MTNAYKIEAGTAQHIGGRPQQNDRAALFGCARAPGYVMAVVADGVQGGALAAEQLLHTSKQLFDEFRPGDAPGVARLSELLREIAREAHTIIRMNPIAARQEPQATVAVLILTPQGLAVWMHVGDCRLYRFARAHCAERSSDAAYQAHLVEHDKLPPEAAKKHRASKLLNNVLGNVLKEPFVTIGSHAGLRAGDAFLLASDGLWQYFSDAELAAVIERHTPRQAAERLIAKAAERAQGKGDNCSMAILKLVKPPAEPADYTVQKMGRAV